MRGRRPAGSLLLICTGLVITALLLFVKNALPSDSAGRDGQLVFCLSAAQRPPLAGAAVTLGLAQPAAVPGELTVAGHAVTLPQWRHDHAADFDRACAALAAAQPQAAPGGGLASDLWSVGSVLASVLVGAALAWMNGEWRATAERNRSQAEALSTAAQAFTQTADTYIADWLAPRAGGTPDDRPLRARRRELAAQLSGVQATHRRW